MSEGLGRSADRPKVFISYSRHDGSALAEELVPGLELAGFEAYLDIHDIEKGVDWEKRLGGLILKADSVVFIITPASVRSPRCQWEVDHAGQLAKRLIPVQWIRVDAAEVPERLRRLNYTIFAEGQSFARPLAELTSALRQDVDWIRTHTVIGEQAARWKARSERGNADDLLLRGSELDNARNWLKRRKDDAPAITELQSAFFSVSEAAEEERVRIEKQQLAERQQLISDADIAKKRWRYARITFDALFFPSRIVPLIDFNDKASLRSVILFWVAIGIISVSLNSIFISAYGIDIALGNPEGDYWMTFLAATQKIIMKHQMLGVLLSLLMTVAFSAFWYAGIRCLVPGSRLPFLGFLQCFAYPSAAIILLFFPLTVFQFVAASDIYSKDFNAIQLLSNHTDLSKDPFIIESCKAPDSFLCQNAFIQKLYPNLFIANSIFPLVLIGWSWINATTIIKGVSGVTRRRTFGGLLLAHGILLLCSVLLILVIVVWKMN